MNFPARINEPEDPVLRRISRALPDAWIDDQWPMRRTPGVTRWKESRTSQGVRLHLLTLIKGLGSFNAACREVARHTDFRRFCRMKPGAPSPSPGTLSKFRAEFGVDGWRRLLFFLTTLLIPSVKLSPVGVCVVDSTDLPAAVRHTWKKKTM
jgi:hypothetical protein